MSTKEYHTLRQVSPGSYNWRIKVRIIRFWRGMTIKGEEFKGFNLLLLDDKNYRLHAFVPGALAEEKEKIIKVGHIYHIHNFTVKLYKADEKFRCIHNDKQIIFTNYTKVEEIVENDSLIQQNMFDFYDLEDLKELANQNDYLTDVIGIVEKEEPLDEIINRNGMQQVKMNFSITDGRCTINVTFWDSLAKELDRALEQDLQLPVIIIIASCKISLWQEKTNISNATPTKFYLNYNHHSVLNMRSLLCTPLFSKHEFLTEKIEKLQRLTINEIKNVGSKYIKKEVVLQAKIVAVHELPAWFICICTSCYREIDCINGNYHCIKCNRIVPSPEKKFSIYTQAVDETGEMDILLEDREVRSLLGREVYEIEEEMENTTDGGFPNIFNTIANSEYNIKIKIRMDNVTKISQCYIATDIFKGSFNETTSNLETSSSTFHLDGLSQMDFQTPEVTKKQGKQMMMNM